MTKRDPEYAERLYTSSLHKAAEEAPHPADRHERWSCLLSIVVSIAAAVACWLVIGWAVSRAAAS